MSSSLKTGMAAPDTRFLPRSSPARWALAFFVLFQLLLDLTPLLRFEAGTQFADIDKVTGPVAWASVIAAIALALSAVVRSRKQALGRILAAGLGRWAFTLAAAALVLTIVGPAIGNADLYLLGGAAAFAAALTGSFASFRAAAQHVTFLPRTAVGTWALCLSLVALARSCFAAAAIRRRPAARADRDRVGRSAVGAGGRLGLNRYSALPRAVGPGPRSDGLVAMAAVYWTISEFVFPGH
ncbi:hypothetical protein AHiyo6_02610 [Arthrobacter sp. Hiyo6]|nr:hypothetical protein AHiyo6_02610 [Arthrobacter sp. Hiyo6]